MGIFFSNCILTVILARIFLNEKFTYYDVFSLLSAFLGVLIINNVFGAESTDKEEIEKHSNYLFGTFLILCSGTSCSIAHL